MIKIKICLTVFTSACRVPFATPLLTNFFWRHVRHHQHLSFDRFVNGSEVRPRTRYTDSQTNRHSTDELLWGAKITNSRLTFATCKFWRSSIMGCATCSAALMSFQGVHGLCLFAAKTLELLLQDLSLC